MGDILLTYVDITCKLLRKFMFPTDNATDILHISGLEETKLLLNDHSTKLRTRGSFNFNQFQRKNVSNFDRDRTKT